jgi:nicotinate-nucleotide adenylyltransferase
LPVPEGATTRAQETQEPDKVPKAPKVGIFGGTFDPPHVGHEAAARAILSDLDLDRLLLMVANDPWQKSPTRPITPAEDRFAMTQALAESIPGASASRLEIDRGGPTYSIETVEAVLDQASREGQPEPQVYLVVGTDLVPELGTWERAAELARLVTLAVVSRPSAPRPAAPPGWAVRWVDGPQVDVSSSGIREILVRGGSVDGLVPPAVMLCMARRDLYAVGR